MEEDSEKIVLKSNIKRFLESSEIIYKKGDFTSSAILYFKTLFAVLDLLILQKAGKIPKDHSERFRILEANFPDLYITLDKFYPLYRDTYSTIISQNDCNNIRENVKRIIREQKIFGNN